MKKLLAFLLIAAMLIPSLAGCGKGTVEPDPAAAGYVEKPVGKVSGVTLDKLDEKLLDYIGERQSGNFVLSPVSFKYACALMLAGAEGNTKREILDAFGLNDESEFDEPLKDFIAYAKKLQGMCSINIANSVWRHESEPELNDEYKRKLEGYDAEYFDFSRNVAKKANEWVNEKTNGIIPKLLPEDFTADESAFILINALYLKSAWETAFKPENTVNDVFVKADGSEVRKDYMRQKDRMEYYSDDDTELVIMRLYGNVRMAFVLGSTENIKNKLSEADDRSVNIAVPKFKVETSLENNELKHFLQACGVSDAFGVADFSGMADGTGAYVDSITQRAKLNIDENGVEGAAATDMVYLGLMSDAPVSFVVDRPFSFFVIAGDYNKPFQVLFEGRVVE